MKDTMMGYILTGLAAALTAVFGFLGEQIKNAVRKHLEDDAKRNVAKTCVNAVEQLYHDLNGDAKLEKAREGILGMLEEKGIPITELELKMLIEAAVGGLNYGIYGKKVDIPDFLSEETEWNGEYVEEGEASR